MLSCSLVVWPVLPWYSYINQWSIAIPPDVIKSRVQSAPAGTYKGFMDCATKIVVQEGPSALFKGLGPALLRAFPVFIFH